MILTDLWLTNFRNHKKLHVPLKTGVTGIVGDNGTGKSSIIEGIQFLFTGELFEGTKEQAIKLETTSGYVAGAFILNGKVGRIERHLDSSKVLLTYNDIDYKKSGEVKELWDKLLQLNADIIKKVVIARQGYIPQLFSGDATVREKVFQRIFLVPPTEKLRAMIWKDYLKQAPPIVPEEDIIQLTNTKDLLEEELQNLENCYGELVCMSEEELAVQRERINFLKKCIDDDGKLYMLGDAFRQAEEERDELAEKKILLQEKLKIDIGKYQRINIMLLQHKGIYAQRLLLEAELAKIECPDPQVVKDLTKRAEDTHNDWQATGELHSITNKELRMLETDIFKLNDLKDEAVCPCCNQPFTDLTGHLTTLESHKEQLLKQLYIIEVRFKELSTQRNSLIKQLEKYGGLEREEEQLKKQLTQFQNITFDEEMLQTTNNVIEHYGNLKIEEGQLNTQYEKTDAKYWNLSREIKTLAIYDGKTDPRKEMVRISNKIERNTENVRIQQQLSVDLRVKQFEIKNLNDRLKNSEQNHLKNIKRNKYVATLNKMYDILHTSQFPRKLIMSYAEIVTEYLQANLEMFDIPYKARVADNFKIEMIDDQDRILPHVSGGQEIMVGISLHLALHDLFSQSFPLMVIDEGTTHLDGPNRKAYFDMIKGLKAKSKLKQILIIDHDPQLSEVVDHVIQLKK